MTHLFVQRRSINMNLDWIQIFIRYSYTLTYVLPIESKCQHKLEQTIELSKAYDGQKKASFLFYNLVELMLYRFQTFLVRMVITTIADVILKDK